jgi:hypothetical protein
MFIIGVDCHTTTDKIALSHSVHSFSREVPSLADFARLLSRPSLNKS